MSCAVQVREAASHPVRGALGRQRSELANRDLPLRDSELEFVAERQRASECSFLSLADPRGKEEVPDDDCQGPSRSLELRNASRKHSEALPMSRLGAL